MFPKPLRLVAASLCTAPLLVACSSQPDSTPTPAPAHVFKREHQHLVHVTADGKRYCADVRAGHKRPSAVHLTNCGHQPFSIKYVGQGKHDPHVVAAGKKVWLKSKSGTYHGFKLTLSAPYITVVGVFTVE